MTAEHPAGPTPAELAARLRTVVAGEVDAGPGRRAQYATDASNYRVVPRVVVLPGHVDDLLAVAEVSRSEGVPVTVRGGGTSVAGNAVGPGIVVDTSRHLTGVPEIDPATRTARVEPGVVLDDLQAAARPHGLRFGPDPSTHGRCTLGGMIGNNACGAHSVAYGRTADNIVELDIVDGRGRRLSARDTARGGGPDTVPGLTGLVRDGLATVRTELGRFPRQVSGYGLEHLLPERGGDLAAALVGSEGTCGLVLGATVRLVEPAPATALVVLGYPDMPAAADAVPAILAHGPLAVEGLDARLVDLVRRHRGAARVAGLPNGSAWLMVEVGGVTTGEAVAAGRAVVAAAGARDGVVLPPGPRATGLWRIREDGAGLAGRTPAGVPAWPGWEDAAVPPERLGPYLRDFEALQREYGVDGLPYGHFGEGCVHIRLGFPLERDVAVFREFLHAAAQTVVAHGGSLSGEHGDGRARGALLPVMYSPAALDLFRRFKGLFDPDRLLNPGVLVEPDPPDSSLRRPAAAPLPLARRPGGFDLSRDDGDLSRAVHRCVGLGKCRADPRASGDVMCPSFLTTRDERDSTRGRARVLQEMANGNLVTRGFRSPEVHEALELCLGCRACLSDCPAGVDMATYKSEVLHHTYRGRPRPVTHYLLGRLPVWARLAGLAPRLVNAVAAVGPLRRGLLRVGGMDPRRRVPRFATRPFHRRVRRGRWVSSGGGAAGGRVAGDNGPAGAAGDGRPPVVLWVDSFTDAFAPAVAEAARDVLAAAGYRVLLPSGRACCGLTWLSTGQLDGARRRLRSTLDTLAPYVDSGAVVVGLEPSCTATLRHDLRGLLPDDPRSGPVADATVTLAEALARPGPDGAPWRPPSLAGTRVVAQPHCHHHAVTGYDTDLALLRRAGAEVDVVSGCCGMAGNFGMERGHYDVSVAVAESSLLPAVRRAPGSVVLADGFSCRTQLAELAGRDAVHLAELLAGSSAR